MTNGVSGNSAQLNVLLKQKQMKLDSLKGQQDTVQGKLDSFMSEEAKAASDVSTTKQSFTEAFTKLQNHPMKGKEQPTEPNKADYQTTDIVEGGMEEINGEQVFVSDGVSVTFDQSKYNADMKQYQAELASYNEMRQLEGQVQELSSKLGIDESELEQLSAAAQETENTLKGINADCDFTTGEIEQLEAQIAELSKAEQTQGSKSGGQKTIDIMNAIKAGIDCAGAAYNLYATIEMASMDYPDINFDDCDSIEDVENTTALADAKAEASEDYPNLDLSDCETVSDVKKTVSSYKSALKEAEKAGVDASDCSSAAEIKAKIKENKSEKAES